MKVEHEDTNNKTICLVRVDDTCQIIRPMNSTGGVIPLQFKRFKTDEKYGTNKVVEYDPVNNKILNATQNKQPPVVPGYELKPPIVPWWWREHMKEANQTEGDGYDRVRAKYPNPTDLSKKMDKFEKNITKDDPAQPKKEKPFNPNEVTLKIPTNAKPGQDLTKDTNPKEKKLEY